LERDRELHSHLLLLMRREHVNDPVHGLSGRLRMEGRKHQVAGLGGSQRGRDRLQVSHLPDQDHVRVLAQRALEGRREVDRVGADLALVEDALLVLMEELDRVLDR
jgi:hypothetical protein